MFFIRNNDASKKKIILHTRAEKEIGNFHKVAQKKIKSLIESLAKNGVLVEPYGKKIDRQLYEIRVKYKGEWRVLYAYVEKTSIVILSAFHKKTQKTPLKEIVKAKQRLKEYI
ncbi:MAG TPA: type II toxin-antitoxin system RelE/ParE family toxin [Patescibacteria group bacterium]